MNYPNALSPIQLAGVQLPNRFCLTATLTNFGSNTRITDRWINFHAERAIGGTGMIVTEAVAVDANAVAHPSVVAAYDPANKDGFTQLAQTTHGVGSAVIAQLWHAGRQQLWHPTRSPQGVSDQPDAYSWTVPHVMTDDEIESVIDAYVTTAERLCHYGLDGVELHGAHGYLITQFLSPWSNTRDDQWGGSPENRARFCLRVAQAIRERCGSDFIIGIKLPADEGVAGGIDIQEAEKITQRLSDAQVFDYFAFSQGNFSLSLENHVPDMHFKPGHFLDFHKRLHQSANGVPIMALGRIDTPELAEKTVAEGYGELVGLCRALVSDAAYVAKLKQQKADDIRPSLYDNYCWGVIHTGRAMIEAHNPQLATSGEANWTPGHSETPSRIGIVGSGPAGLEAAWLCAARGNDVTLFCPTRAPGGKLRLEATLPGHGAVQHLINYQLNRCAEQGVTFAFDNRPTADDFSGSGTQDLTDFDHVIVATGADMRRPDALDHSQNNSSVISQSLYAYVRQHMLTLASDPSRHDDKPRQYRTAVVFDQDHTAPVYALAQHLCERYERVVLITPRAGIAETVNYCSKLGILRRLYETGVEIHPATTLETIETDDVICRNVFSQRLEVFDRCDLLVYATPRQVNEFAFDGFADAAGTTDQQTPQFHQIGDSKSPRNLMIAIHEAHALAATI